MSAAAFDAWQDAIEERRARVEQRWAELSAAGEHMVEQLKNGERADAVGSAKTALAIEYDLTGDVTITNALCEALGITVEETEAS